MVKDIREIEEKLEMINFQLEADLKKKESQDENSKDILNFYEKLIDNSKQLNNFLKR